MKEIDIAVIRVGLWIAVYLIRVIRGGDPESTEVHARKAVEALDKQARSDT